jgi:hypothetical protein
MFKRDEIGQPSLKFISYEGEGDIDILKLKWYTKHACEDDAVKPRHWGFFTWFLIM